MYKESRSPVTYSLCLSNGQSWNLNAGKDLEIWLSRLAGVLRLSPSAPVPGRSDFYFTTDQVVADNLSPNVWQELPSRYLTIYLNRSNADICCLLHGNFLGDRIEEVVMMLFGIQGIFASAIRNGGVPLHAALICRDGQGIAIAAPGGTGKSTCATRVRQPWVALADDAGLAVISGEGHYLIHPMPTWSVFFDYQDWNASWQVEQAPNLELICTLKRSDTDAISPLGNGNAAALIYQSALQIWRGTQSRYSPATSHQHWTAQIFENSCRLARSVPCVTLEATKEGCFWEEIDRFLESSGKRE
jgi:SynChlorMet cassette protein ScmC